MALLLALFALVGALVPAAAAPRTEVVSPRMLRVAGAVGPMSAPDLAVSGQVLIKVDRALSTADLGASLQAQGFTLLHRYQVGSVALAGLPTGMSITDGVLIIRQVPQVRYSEPNRLAYAVRVPNDTRYGEQYQWPLIMCPEAWDVQIGSSSVVAAVIDSGLDYTHPDLSSRVWINSAETPGNGIDDDANGFIDDVRGWDFANDDNDPMDGEEHGTHVAGAMGAATNNSLGVAGADWNSRLMAVKVFPDGGGGGSFADIMAGIEYATANGAQVMNMSIQGGYTETLNDVITAAYDANVVVVVAAGNFSVVFTDDQDTWFSPVCNDGPLSTDNHVLGVAACDEDKIIADFSNLDGSSREFVDVVAPGVDTLSTRPGNRYQTMSGTSMACPIAAGVTSLVVAENLGAGAGTIINLMRAACTSIDAENPSKIGLMGQGLVNAVGALVDLPPGPARSVRAFDTPNDEGGSITVAWQRSVDDGRGFNDVLGYRVYQADSASGPFAPLGGDLPAGSTMLLDTPVADETDFWYRVDVFDAENVVASAIVGPAQARDDLPPNAVDTLTVEDTPTDDGGSINLDWGGYSGPTDLDHFRVYRATANFTDVSAMTPVPGGESIPSTESTFVDAATTDGVSYWYAVTAVDDKDNELKTVVATGPVRSFPNRTFRFGTGLTMMALPMVPDDLDMGSILDPTGTVTFQLARWDPSLPGYVMYDENPTAPILRQALGRGFWLRLEAPLNVDVSGTVAPGATGTEFGVSVVPGWNMVGNPFTEALTFGDTTVTPSGGTEETLDQSNDNGHTANYAWAWSGGSYRLVSAILPPPAQRTLGLARGVFFRAYRNATLHLNKPVGALAVEAEAPAAAAPSVDDWLLRLVATTAGAQDTDNFLGVSPQAAERNHVVSPPMLEAGVDLYFTEPGANEPLATSFTEPGRTAQWEAVVACGQPGQEVTLSWPDLSSLPNSVRPLLTDLSTGQSVYLRTATSYRFVAGSQPRTLRISLLQSGNVMVTALSASSASGKAEIVYTLSAAARVTVEVMNMSGRTVRVLSTARLAPAGVSALVWDGRNSAGSVAPAGTYLVRVTAENETGQRTSVLRSLSLQR